MTAQCETLMTVIINGELEGFNSAYEWENVFTH